jgi:hypothetical protein
MKIPIMIKSPLLLVLLLFIQSVFSVQSGYFKRQQFWNIKSMFGNTEILVDSPTDSLNGERYIGVFNSQQNYVHKNVN